MSTLTYDSKLTTTIDDRILAHLQIVIWAKLRRDEQFPFTWVNPASNGYGRNSVWISRSISLSFQYFGGKMPGINPKWIEVLMKSANSVGGLQSLPEPE